MRRILPFACAWGSLVVVALVSAVYEYYRDDDGIEDIDFSQSSRWLSEIKSHSAKPIYNENHKPLFPLDKSDYWGLILATLGLMVASGGGIGGGGILVPIYIIVMGFSPRHAIPLSNVTVFAGAIANTIQYWPKRHPLADRPLVDWDLILVMEPLTIAGALIGAFLNKVLPELLLTVLLVLLLAFTAWTTLEKSVKMYKKESKAIQQAAQSKLKSLIEENEGEIEIEETSKLLDNVHTTDQEVEVQVESQSTEDPVKRELNQILATEREIPMENIKILAVMFAVVLSVNLLKGGGAFKSPLGIKCGSGAFWFANAFLFGWIVTVSAYVRQHLVQGYKRKEATNYPYVEGDIKWDGRATVVYPVVCCAAGFFAGMFGVVSLLERGSVASVVTIQYLTHEQATYSHSLCSSAPGRWHCQRTSHVGNGCTPCSIISNFGCHDLVHFIYCHNIIYCLWTLGARLRCGVLDCWICSHLCGPVRHGIPHAQLTTQLVHCIFDWRGCLTISHSHDNPVTTEHGSGREASLWWYLWQG
jgi:uncharacterized membrane protein YfcA